MPIKITRLVFDGLPDDVDPNSLVPLEWDEQGNVKNWAMNLLEGESGEEFDTVGPNDVDVMMKVGRRMFRAEELLRAQMEAAGIKALPEYPAAVTSTPATATPTTNTNEGGRLSPQPVASAAVGISSSQLNLNLAPKTRLHSRPRPHAAYATSKGRQLRLLVPSSSRFLYISGWVLVACLGILIMVLLAMLILRPSAFAFFGFGFGTSPAAATTALAPATPVQVQLNLKSEVVYRLPISLNMFSP